MGGRSCTETACSLLLLVVLSFSATTLAVTKRREGEVLVEVPISASAWS